MARQALIPAAATVAALVVTAGCGGTAAKAPATYVGMKQSEARKFGDKEAKARAKEAGADLKFQSISAGTTKEGKKAWEVRYSDEKDKYKDLCVWVRPDPKDPKIAIVDSASCDIKKD
jgi:hypothetical protein